MVNLWLICAIGSAMRSPNCPSMGFNDVQPFGLLIGTWSELATCTCPAAVGPGCGWLIPGCDPKSGRCHCGAAKRGRL